MARRSSGCGRVGDVVHAGGEEGQQPALVGFKGGRMKHLMRS